LGLLLDEDADGGLAGWEERGAQDEVDAAAEVAPATLAGEDSLPSMLSAT